jgi:hypothetical protein
MDGYFQHFQEKISRRWIPHSALPRIGAAPRTGSSPFFSKVLKTTVRVRQGLSGVLIILMFFFPKLDGP